MSDKLVPPCASAFQSQKCLKLYPRCDSLVRKREGGLVRPRAWRNSRRRGGCLSRRKSGGRWHSKKVVGAIAHRASIRGGSEVPIRIGAQVLRERQASADHAAWPGFTLPSDDAASAADQPATRRAGWRQADVKRAIDAAEKAGLRAYRIEIAPDGTITIVVDTPAGSGA